MLITERHIQYLEWVDQGRIVVRNSKYAVADWANGHIEVDQLIALHSERMGLTHIISRNEKTVVALTSHGFTLLDDERESWG